MQLAYSRPKSYRFITCRAARAPLYIALFMAQCLARAYSASRRLSVYYKIADSSSYQKVQLSCASKIPASTLYFPLIV
jgi:hypothetical protein